MKRVFPLMRAFFFLTLLSGCAGVPLMSAVKLATVNPLEIIEGDPTQFMFALNVDGRVAGTREKRPALHIKVEPSVVGDYDKFDRRLDFELASVEARSLGLSEPGKNRAWVIYRMSPAAVKGVRDFQTYSESVRKRKEKKGGGNLSIGIDNDWLIEAYPQYSDSHVQMWLQWKSKDGFLKLWSGQLGKSAGI